MKKAASFASIVIAVAALMFVTSCEKKEKTVGEKLDNAIENTSKGVHQFTQKAETATEDFNKKIENAIKENSK